MKETIQITNKDDPKDQINFSSYEDFMAWAAEYLSAFIKRGQTDSETGGKE